MPTVNITRLASQAKQAALDFACTASKQKNMIIKNIVVELEKNKDDILAANRTDVARAKKNKLPTAFLDRLTLKEESYQLMLKSLRTLTALKDPIGRILESHRLTCGARLQKKSVPLGVIAIIYEARPNVTIETASLCLKSGNAVILKGGSEAIATNRILVENIKKALRVSEFSPDLVQFVDSTNREKTKKILKQENTIDVVIPRGGYGLVRMVNKESRIPVLSHAAGLAHTYVDKSANIETALNVCLNAKTDRPSTCNSLDTILVHREIATNFLPEMAKRYEKEKVRMHCDKQSYSLLKKTNSVSYLRAASEQDFLTEHLALVVNIKVVRDIEEAIEFINTHGSRHSEAILARDKKAIARFRQAVDAAALFINCSTRLHDGGIFGFGAEMGIATGKLHARGPIGLEELCTYKYIVTGNGTIRQKYV